MSLVTDHFSTLLAYPSSKVGACEQQRVGDTNYQVNNLFSVATYQEVTCKSENNSQWGFLSEDVKWQRMIHLKRSRRDARGMALEYREVMNAQ